MLSSLSEFQIIKIEREDALRDLTILKLEIENLNQKLDFSILKEKELSNQLNLIEIQKNEIEENLKTTEKERDFTFSEKEKMFEEFVGKIQKIEEENRFKVKKLLSDADP